MSQDENRPLPTVVDRSMFHEQLEALRPREKTHTREGDGIAAARRRLPMVEVAADSPLLGPHGPVTLLDAFEGRRQLIAYYFMWWPGRAASEQCEGCTWVMSHVGELAYLHSRDITFAVLCQGRNTAYGPGDAQMSYDESLRYRTFMGWDMPWYSAQPSLDSLLVDRETVCSTWCATCEMATRSSRRTGPGAVVPRCWTTATRLWTSLCSVGRRTGRTRLRAGRGAGTRPDPGRGSRLAAPVGVARRSSHLSMATARAGYSEDLGAADEGAAAPSGSLSLIGLTVAEASLYAGLGRTSSVFSINPHGEPLGQPCFVQVAGCHGEHCPRRPPLLEHVGRAR